MFESHQCVTRRTQSEWLLWALECLCESFADTAFQQGRVGWLLGYF